MYQERNPFFFFIVQQRYPPLNIFRMSKHKALSEALLVLSKVIPIDRVN